MAKGEKNNRHQRADMFQMVSHSFTEVDEVTLFLIKDRLILRHRKHEGFSVRKDGKMECDQCNWEAEQTDRGFIVLQDSTLSYLIAVDVSEEEREYAARILRARGDEP